MSNFFADAVRFTATSAGTGDFVVNTAVQGYRTPGAASCPNSSTSSYRAESSSLSEWEEGIWTYNSGTGTCARTTVTANSLGTTAKINFTAAPQVALVLASADITDAGKFTSGTVPPARLGSNTPSSSNWLRGDSAWVSPPGRIIAFNKYTSSQTITIPPGATGAMLRMTGGGGGNSNSIGNQGGSGAGSLEKLLLSLTPGNTFAYTNGAAGGLNGNGGNSVLASGTQPITTLTAGGGLAGPSSANTNSNGGTATNGDNNVSGQGSYISGNGCGGAVPIGIGGMSGLGMGMGGNGSVAATAGYLKVWWLS